MASNDSEFDGSYRETGGCQAPNSSIVAPQLAGSVNSLNGLTVQVLQVLISRVVSGEAPAADAFDELDPNKTGTIAFADVIALLPTSLGIVHKDDFALTKRFSLSEFETWVAHIRK